MGRLVAAIVVSGVVSIWSVQASDDAYLRMIEGEAAGVRLDDSGQLKKSGNVPRQEKKVFEWHDVAQAENIPKSLDKEQFEAFLKENFYGTFVFYHRLNTTDQQTVFHRYSKAETPDLESVRQNVMGLLKQ